MTSICSPSPANAPPTQAIRTRHLQAGLLRVIPELSSTVCSLFVEEVRIVVRSPWPQLHPGPASQPTLPGPEAPHSHGPHPMVSPSLSVLGFPPLPVMFASLLVIL